MSLLGIDVGTTGCKSAIFSETGQLLAFDYKEYHHQNPKPGWAQLNVEDVWEKIKQTIGRVANTTDKHSIKALSITSMGEALVPVTKDRKILGSSILNFDNRGSEFIKDLNSNLPTELIFSITGNNLGNHFSLSKLMWMKKYQSKTFYETDYLLPWASFVAFMLGADPTTDFSLANRTLLFDINRETWSKEIIDQTELDHTKLPNISATGTVIGEIAEHVADELGLPHGISIINGAHDQCVNAVGCGAIEEGRTLLGMGTFICAAPVFRHWKNSELMIERGLNIEHHAVPGKFVTFIYNQGGSIVKWYRDTFASIEHQRSKENGNEIYTDLFSEMPTLPSRIIVLPTFSSTGLPNMSTETAGVFAGLKLDTERGEILKGIIESVIFDMKESIDSLPPTGINIADFRVVGGGSKSDDWIQVCADILDRPLARPKITESGAMGSAIIAGVGSGIFSSFDEGVASMIRIEDEFYPNPKYLTKYQERFNKYVELKQMLLNYLKDLSNRDS